MANPNYPSDGQNERVDALVDIDGTTVYLKQGIDPRTAGAATNEIAATRVGTHLIGGAPGGSDAAVAILGSDGSVLRLVKVDTNGNWFAVGVDPVAGPPSVNPFGVAGFDGTDLQYLKVGTDGRVEPVGVDAVAAAPTVNPLLSGWWDGTDVRIPRTDTNGYTLPVGSGYTDGVGTVFSRRIPNIFKTNNTSSSGNTAIWTPSGKKFRLMKCMLMVTADVATTSGARIVAQLEDASTPIGVTFEFWAPSASVTTTGGDAFNSGWVDLGDSGYLSTTNSNSLNLNLSAALTAGKARLIAAGTEE